MVKPTVEAIDVDPKTGTTLGFYTYGHDRPNVLIISAMTGMSSTCVYTNFLLMKELENVVRIDVSVTILPVANPLAFRLGTKISPLDSQDLDTVFPGDEQGTVTQRTAWEIWRRASKADYVLQLHTGWQSCVSHIVAMHREYIHVRNLASQISLPLVVQSSGQRGSLTTEVAHDGIPAVKVEMRGGVDLVDPQAAVEVRESFLNFFRIKDMIPGDPIEAASVFAGRMQHINVDTEGFFVPLLDLGEDIRNEEVIGQVQDKSDIASPFDGRIASLSQMRYVFEGDIIARIASPLIDKWIPESEEEDTQIPTRRKW
ncbi:MAG: succinylglutamate desuccinylase/aspartoacylase family protein [Candidatus Thorarchaeota archaeon]|jgi:predicted deacylase